MSSSGHPEVTAEVERKYDVDAATVLPSLSGVDGIARMGQAQEHRLEAVYYDTAGLDLARHRVTLRRRTGGDDAGWHLKLPAGGDARTEVRLPLDARAVARGPDDPDQPPPVPAALLVPVRAIVRDRPLVPVARLRTRRHEHELLDEQGDLVAHLCDDDVEAQSLVGSQVGQRWREWEVELVGQHAGLLETVEHHLLEAGASPAGHTSKLRRALAGALPEAEPPAHASIATAPAVTASTVTASTSTGSPSTQVLLAYLVEHRGALLEHDAGVRQGDSEPVHKMRVAARRLRSALTTYRPVLGREVADPLREELRWLGLALSEARDAHVLRGRLAGVLAAEPPELVVGPVVARLDQELGTTQQHGREAAVTALESSRYYRLLDGLDDLVAALSTPSPTGSGAATAAREVPRLVRRDWKRLRTAVEDVGRAPDTQARDRALHEARKKAKRLRYAAESAIPVHADDAVRMARAAEAVQEALGAHQDTVVARARLRSIAMTAHLDGENAFTFGRLHALEEWRADRAERDFDKAWRRLSRRRVRRWLRS